MTPFVGKFRRPSINEIKVAAHINLRGVTFVIQ